MRDLITKHAALQAAIKALGFKLTLEDDYVPFANSGYLPCTLDGEDAGLTISFIDSDIVAGMDAVIVLQSGGGPREEATILMIAANVALMKQSGIKVYLIIQLASISLHFIEATLAQLLRSTPAKCMEEKPVLSVVEGCNAFRRMG